MAPVYLPTVPTYVPTDLPTHLPTYLFTYLPTYLPTRLFTYLPLMAAPFSWGASHSSVRLRSAALSTRGGSGFSGADQGRGRQKRHRGIRHEEPKTARGNMDVYG